MLYLRKYKTLTSPHHCQNTSRSKVPHPKIPPEPTHPVAPWINKVQDPAAYTYKAPVFWTVAIPVVA